LFRSLLAVALLVCAMSPVCGADPALADESARPVRPGDAEGSDVADASFDVATLLCEYNEAIDRALSEIDSLRVDQLIFEPQADGSTKRAEASLSYSRGSGMQREVTLAEISHLLGRYTLTSLVGPEVDATEYEVEYLGRETKEDVPCHKLKLTAIKRDADHFDGTLWISVEEPGPVRIVGTVADPPFPAVVVTLDKAFLPGPGGIWLVRRHTGEAEVKLLVTRRGTRHVFYERYDVKLVGASE
jgi:hypothetical protein